MTAGSLRRRLGAVLADDADDRGSSPVEFVLVGAMLTILTLGVLQLGLGVYVRNVVHDAAVEGAYHAALADNAASDGAAWTRRIISRTVGGQYAQNVRAQRSAEDVRITVQTTLPLVGLLGIPHALEVTARAPVESLDYSLRERAASTADAGSAALEFIFVGVLMLVPLVYLIVTLGLIQGQTLGTEAGARHIARAVATAPDADAASRRADEVLQAVASDYDIDPSTVDLSLTCAPAGAECPSAGATVRVTVRARVALPLVPQLLGMDRWASIRVESHASQHVSQFWAAR